MAKKKKVFISVPMRNRKPRQIRYSISKLHKIAEAVFDQELDAVVSYYASEVPPEWCKNESIYHLGNAIKLMSECDFYIGVNWSSDYGGCNIENSVALEYQIPRFQVPLEAALTPGEFESIAGKW